MGHPAARLYILSSWTKQDYRRSFLKSFRAPRLGRKSRKSTTSSSDTFCPCHLIIEHYLDEYLNVIHPELKWDAARLTFSQKITLISELKIEDKYNCIPAFKHMNSLRNKLSHDIQFRTGSEDLLPLTEFLARTYEGKAQVPTEPMVILEHFTTMACVFFAGYISGFAKTLKLTVPHKARK